MPSFHSIAFLLPWAFEIPTEIFWQKCSAATLTTMSKHHGPNHCNACQATHHFGGR